MSTATTRSADNRCAMLGGARGFIPNHAAMFQRPGSLKSVDWMHINGCFEYIFKDLLSENIAESLFTLSQTIEILLNLHSNIDQEPEDGEPTARAGMELIKLKVIRNLCIVEKRLPLTDQCGHLHDLLHVPDAVFRWNAVRNFWSFFNERYLIL